MTQPIIQIDSGDEDQAAVLAWLREYNLQENGSFMRSLTDGAERKFFLIAKLESGILVGGIRGSTSFDWLRIEQMAVSPEYRRTGIGRRLVAAAESLGIESHCCFSYVDSMSYQVPEFYEKLGYREVGRLPNWDSQGHDKVFFMRQLGSTTNGS